MPVAFYLLMALTSTSDHQEIRSLSLTSRPLSDLNWAYEGEPPTLSGWTADLFAGQLDSHLLEYQRYQARAGYYWKRDGHWTGEIWAGAHQFEQDRALDKGHSDPVGELAVQHKIDGLLIGTKLQSHYALDRLSPITGDLENLYSLSAKPSLQYVWREDWKANLRGHYDWLRDGNTHAITDVQLLRALSRDQLWLWVGVGSEYTTNSKRSTQYWSPSAASSYGVRYDFAYGFNDKWTVLSGASLHALKEEKSGTGHYFSSSLQYGKRGDWQTRLSFESVNSLQGANHWSSQTFMLYFTKSK